jgi:nicotinamide-nucleotide amidase
LHEGLLRQIEQIFLGRHLDFKPNNKRQAYIPEGALPIENPQGTAPGFIIETETGTLISIPGVPREMKYLLRHTVLPYLRQKIGRARVLRQRLLKICGMGESNVDAAVGDLMRTSVNPEIGLLAHAGQTDIRLTAKADTSEEAEQLLTACEQRIRARLPYQIFGVDADTQEGVIVRLLRERHLRLALAETNTGGRIAQHLIRVPEATDVFAGGVVISDTASLENLLNLSPALLAEHPLINPEIAQHIAEAIKLRCGADLGLGVCGHLRSANELTTDATVPAYIALCQQDGACVMREYKTAGSAEMVQSRVMNMALEFLRRTLLGLDPGLP